ncbi:MAG: flagellar biosynthesis anti-sigma factor FlgM [Eubacterium sp.]|jgi:hypothetical protein|nr:flagellar biosynthesis anti-sigma factor FlgM [Eubacterium sp.]
MNVKNLNSNMINAYKSIGGIKISKDKISGTPKSGSENVDKIEFDFARSIEAAKSDIAASVNFDANAEKIESLSIAYTGDNCPVDGAAVAEAIFDK